MIQHKIFRSLVWLILAAMVSACSPDKKPYKVTFRVTLPDGRPVQNAFIYLYTPVENSLIDGIITTNQLGEVTWQYDHKAIIKYEASKAGYKRCDVIELRQGTIFVDVVIYPENDPRRACLPQ
ncbi:hypothetical protein [Schleiferia thermophila]|jgi:hypothetical protein|nr:hypothetical protein [Schleiferia thermophila]KFD38128.1 hypothetical protein AT05_11670 [Schleiferia thermophila str. Yellowstone]